MNSLSSTEPLRCNTHLVRRERCNHRNDRYIQKIGHFLVRITLDIQVPGRNRYLYAYSVTVVTRAPFFKIKQNNSGYFDPEKFFLEKENK